MSDFSTVSSAPYAFAMAIQSNRPWLSVSLNKVDNGVVVSVAPKRKGFSEYVYFSDNGFVSAVSEGVVGTPVFKVSSAEDGFFLGLHADSDKSMFELGSKEHAAIIGKRPGVAV